jgi:hypothetical protein
MWNRRRPHQEISRPSLGQFLVERSLAAALGYRKSAPPYGSPSTTPNVVSRYPPVGGFPDPAGDS